ncbi:Isochorismatase family protein YecD [compost metagenome]
MLGVQRLIVAGVATHSVVENTVREAADLGYDISVASDACSAAAPQMHQAALSSMALIAEITTVADALQAD